MPLQNYHHWTGVDAVRRVTVASLGMVVAESGDGCGGPLRSVFAQCRSGQRLDIQLGPVCRGWARTLLSQEGGLAEDEFDDDGCIV